MAFDDSRIVQWLGYFAFTEKVRVQFPVREDGLVV